MIDGERTQVKRNTLASISYFLASALIALWLVPYLIARIGVDGYGLVVLGLSLTAYVSLAAGSVNTSISRFLTVDINRGEFVRANETFNTAFFGALAGVVLVIPLLWLFAANVSSIINIAEEHSHSASAFVLLLSLAFILTFLRNILTVPAFAGNRLDLIFLCQGIDLFAKILLLISLMSLLTPDVLHVGTAVLFGAVAAIVFSIFFWRGLAPYLTLSPRKARYSRFAEVFTMSTWVMVNSTGALLFLNVDLITANRIVGTAAAGQFGAILQIVIALRAAASLPTRIVAPLIFSRFAKGDFDELQKLLIRSTKYVGILVACPVGIVCAWSEEFLNLWLGPEFVHLKWLVWITTIHLASNLSCRPLFFLQQAANRVKYPAIVTLALGLVHIGLSVGLGWGLGWGLYGIAISSAVTLSAKNSVFTVLYGAAILRKPSHTFVLSMLVTVFCTGLALLLGEVVSVLIPVASWQALITLAGMTSLLYFLLVWFFVLHDEDRTFVRTNVIESGQPSQ